MTVIQASSALASATSAEQTPYPGSEFIDLGVKVKATPTLHPNHEVTLQLEFEIRALAGTNINGIPIISNRTLSQTVRVKEEETTVIGGLLDDEETRAITGLPGFANLPGAGYLFGTRNNSNKETEFMILVTPRRLRSPVRQPRNLFAGRGDITTRGSLGAGVPQQPPPPPPQEQPQPQQQQQPPQNQPENQPEN